MKITFLMPGYPWGPSGGCRVVYEYANRLASRGHQVAVVHPRHLKYLPPEQLTAYQWLRRKAKRLRRSLSKPSIEWQPIDKRVRLLFVPSSESSDIPEGDAIFATSWHTVASVLRCPPAKGEKCYLIQGYEVWQGPKELVDSTWCSAVHKVVVSKWLLEVGRNLGCRDIVYIPNAIDHERYRRIRPIDGRPQQVAMLFSGEQIKGSADGVVALEIARQRHPDLRVILFGNYPRQSRIPKWIEFYRDPPQDFVVNEIYNNSRIFLSPSWTEGSPLPPMEAAACGCAVVATDIPGHREYIRHGVTGVLSPARDPNTLAQNLCLLLESDSLRVQLAKAFNDFVCRLSWERSADLLEDFIMGLADGRTQVSQISSD